MHPQVSTLEPKPTIPYTTRYIGYHIIGIALRTFLPKIGNSLAKLSY